MRRELIVAILLAAILSAPALASIGGPDLAAPLGWNRATNEVFFSAQGVNESGCPARILRLSLARGEKDFKTLAWSECEPGAGDSLYRAKLRALKKRLEPLEELSTTTIAERNEIVSADTVEIYGERWPRFKVHVSWFNGACEGTVEAVTYRDPSVRLLRCFIVPGTQIMIGVFSFVGIPFEFGYETQIPTLLPGRKAIIHLESKPSP